MYRGTFIYIRIYLGRILGIHPGAWLASISRLFVYSNPCSRRLHWKLATHPVCNASLSRILHVYASVQMLPAYMLIARRIIYETARNNRLNKPIECYGDREPPNSRAIWWNRRLSVDFSTLSMELRRVVLGPVIYYTRHIMLELKSL